MAEVAEGFAFLSVLLEVDEQRHQCRDHVCGRDEIFVDEIQPITHRAAADKDRVLAQRLSDEADIGVVGTSAPVGASSFAL